MRSRLISFFEWRGAAFPEDHADEALNRVVRKIDGGVQLRDPATYVFGIARMLLLEIAKDQHKKRAAVEQVERQARAASESRSGSGNFVALALTPGIARSSDETERILLPANASAVRLQLDLEREEEYRSYRVEIRTAGGDLVWSQAGLSVRPNGYGQAVFLTLPSGIISPGEYEVALKGITEEGKLEDAAYHYFIALRR